MNFDGAIIYRSPFFLQNPTAMKRFVVIHDDSIIKTSVNHRGGWGKKAEKALLSRVYSPPRLPVEKVDALRFAFASSYF